MLLEILIDHDNDDDGDEDDQDDDEEEEEEKVEKEEEEKVEQEKEEEVMVKESAVSETEHSNLFSVNFIRLLLLPLLIAHELRLSMKVISVTSTALPFNLFSDC
ncbi:hypothetical protein PoB_003774000 [Plakobranchus ocellatus]|uniref:Uncharacterized protein n=1 Tax=Plakobranchus ocellatus TaxID=259542 RepID=A0AAV4AWL6_9GAST|nr:hypothetical protein PoB_003774000 [Plakobranchus ocellatus]